MSRFTAETGEAEEIVEVHEYQSPPEVPATESPPDAEKGIAIDPLLEDNLRTMEKNPRYKNRVRAAKCIREALKEGVFEFSQTYWRERFGYTSQAAK